MSSVGQALEWLRGGPPFDPEQQARFEADRLEGNTSRIRLIVPLFLVTQLVVASRSLAIGAVRMRLDPDLLSYRDVLAVVHLGTAFGCLVFMLPVFFARGGVQRQLGWGAGLLYFLHASVVVGAGQLRGTGITVYLIACAAVALLLSLSSRALVFVYLVGFASFVLAVGVMQDHPAYLLSVLFKGSQATLAGLVLALFLTGARRRDFRQTDTIARQQLELERLNATLEERVAAQVKALTRRADEVERLNTQLQAQVRDRSRALTNALRKLAAGEGAPGDLEGRVIGERFSVGPKLAAGGMGAVYEGVDLTTDEPVAVKVIHSSAGVPLSMMERFLREAESAATVHHPAIVRMLHVDIDDDGTFYQVQEFVRGETLEQALDRHDHFKPQVGIQVLVVLCDALAAAHAKGLVHRDIKPANLMLTREEPGLKVVDFGISKIRNVAPRDTGGETVIPNDSVETLDPSMTLAGAMMGTPRYMSPEQRVDASQVTDRADLYAVGLVALQLFRGTLLMPGEKAPFAELELLPEPLASMLDRCLSREPTDRPMATELRDAARAAASEARPLHELVVWNALQTS